MGKNVEKEREKREKKEQKEREKRENRERKRMNGWDKLLKNFKILNKDCKTFPNLIDRFNKATTEDDQTAITKEFNELLEYVLTVDQGKVIEYANDQYTGCRCWPNDYAKAHKNVAPLVRQYKAFERKIGTTDTKLKEIITSTKNSLQKILESIDNKLSQP